MANNTLNVGDHVCFTGNGHRGWRQSPELIHGEVIGFENHFVIIRTAGSRDVRKMEHTLTRTI